MALLLIGYLAGLIAGVSPCILPVLPVIFVGWTAPVDGEKPVAATRRRRSLVVMAGLVVSFGLLTALGSVLISSLHLPQNLLRDAGIALLVLFGAGLMSSRLERLLERPFSRLSAGPLPRDTSAFVLGLGLGAVFVPCAGPVLATISVLGATHRASLYSVLLSLCFAAGAATPLFALALVSDRIAERSRALAKRTRQLRPFAGALLMVAGLSIALNWTAPLQRWIPNYTASLQHRLEGTNSTQHDLRALTQGAASDGSLIACEQIAGATAVTTLQECGAAPQFTGISAWLNTPGNQPINLTALRGHVVLIDFFTYSCINCQRSLPHVEAWYQRYHQSGLDVIGIQAPEFAFEHDLSNITDAAKALGIDYPIAVDNNLATWTAYSNEYWPAEYLIDAHGVIRHVAYGEGAYGSDEQLIRALLRAARPTETLPPATNVPDRTPTQALSPETYLGSERSQYLQGGIAVQNGEAEYQFPANISLGNYALAGPWRTTNEYIASSQNSQLRLHFEAQHVYLVLGGHGTVRETLNGRYLRTVTVKGYPTLYTLLQEPSVETGVLGLRFSPGVEAYDFTFG